MNTNMNKHRTNSHPEHRTKQNINPGHRTKQNNARTPNPEHPNTNPNTFRIRTPNKTTNTNTCSPNHEHCSLPALLLSPGFTQT